mmetsp:Transcript_11592/g.18858  ORF Transcript_11592/g.18858 Transcript_11592/m.18858 type:complete len:246 (-) Transcript_11592:333-1070(-)|eukprot:CAMPEP_0203747884 /NCGR_PEP_ID=MMETSP0098-20131031/2907_1 /ASSEMBLY_ACC=CAM_ASM_000208 /TAXON_ID=96639 /ORGANISM=" , Strain NY0313808BC1" /LENGTH=245 /DNA_ID=CAMNT_0050636453 /DNA_START=497 /DNA_END=1234 /DNA_ORIENTATION=-
MRVHSNSFLAGVHSAGSPLIGLILLNFDIPHNLLVRLWGAASVKICADGGANRLFSMTQSNRGAFVPDFIVGDLDSLEGEVHQYYKGLGTDVRKVSDQNYHDFHKCLEVMLEAKNKKGIDDLQVVVLGAFGGRLDQEMANLNMLYIWKDRLDKLVLASQHSTARLLDAGHHKIIPNRAVETGTCGLIPLGVECTDVTTSGLKWNLLNQSLQFGGLISSSNSFVDSEVFVTTNSPLIWTTVLSSSL